MKRGRGVGVIGLCVTWCFVAVPQANSWESLAHYQLGIDAAGARLAPYQNLPDVWPSHSGWRQAWGISEWFAWSHAVQRTGRTDGIPHVPVDASGLWNPGKVLYRLYKTRSVNGHGSYETALGFLMHLAQDREVHYAYFRGGSFPSWTQEHQYKEQWADCIVYQTVTYRTTSSDDGFEPNGNGRPKGLPRVAVMGHAEAIHKAQKEFVASGYSVDDSLHTTIRAQDPSAIVKDITDYQPEIDTYLGKINREYCRQYQRLARRYNWTAREARGFYDRSLAATKQILTAYPE